MNDKSTAYEVGFKIVTHRSTVVFAANPAEALKKARMLLATEPDSDLFESTTTETEEWRADEVQP